MSNIDRIHEAYLGNLWGEEFAEKTRKRVHWICSKVQGNKVLDVGCSQGTVSLLLGREGKKVTGLDLSSESIEYANNVLAEENSATQKNVKFLNDNFISSTLLDKSYNTILMTEVLEHLTNPDIFIKRAWELLTSDGTCVVTVPFGVNDFIDHKRTYFYAEIFESLNPYFEIIEHQIFGKWIGFVGKRKKVVKGDFKALPKEIVREIELTFEKIERDLQHNIAAAQKHFSSAKSNYETAKTWMKERDEKISQLKIHLVKNDESIKAREERIKELTAERIALSERLDNANQSIQSDNSDIKNLLHEIVAENLKGRLEVNQKIEDSLKEISFVNHSISDELKNNAEEALKNRIEINQRIEDLLREIDSRDSLFNNEFKGIQNELRINNEDITEKIGESIESFNNSFKTEYINQIRDANLKVYGIEKQIELVINENRLLKKEINNLSNIVEYNRESVKKIYRKQFDDKKLIVEVADHLLAKKRKKNYRKKRKLEKREKQLTRLRKIYSLLIHGFLKGLRHPLKFIKYSSLLIINIIFHHSKTSEILNSIYLYVVEEKRDEKVLGNKRLVEKYLQEVKQQNLIHSNFNSKMQKDAISEKKIVNDNVLTVNNPEKITEKFIRKVEFIDQLKVAAIMDEFTIECFKHEVELIQLKPETWIDQLSKNQPDMLFVESCWRGNDGSWGTLTKGSGGGRKLGPIIKWFRERNIPTVFWNKEDPVHFDKFGPIAKLFDFAITTDSDMVSEYKNIFDIDVYVMPFFCQPKIHNPMGSCSKDKKDVVFAGSYYRDKEQRCSDFNSLIDAIESAGCKVDIFDRNIGTDNEKYQFPEKYRKMIQGYLEPSELSNSINKYKYQVNINSVKNSNTMFARRVYESLATGTPIVSNYSLGIHSMFGDLVVSSDKSENIKGSIIEIEKNSDLYLQKRLSGIREALSNHTLSNRLVEVSKIIGQPLSIRRKKIGFVYFAERHEELKSVLDMFLNKAYEGLKLFVVIDRKFELFDYLRRNTLDVNFIVDSEKIRKRKIKDLFNVDYVLPIRNLTIMSENTITDFINAMLYSNAGMISIGNSFEEVKYVELNQTLISSSLDISLSDLIFGNRLRASKYQTKAITIEGLK